jgi:arylsulfatase
MEVFAAFLTHADAQIGRLVNFLKDIGRFESTLVLVTSDNGASPEGGRHGTVANTRYLNGVTDTAEEIDTHLNELGGPATYPHYPFGWAWAGNCPLKRWKQETHEGGITVPLIVSWPRGIHNPSTIRRQFVHAIDVAPTLLAINGISEPKAICGVHQSSMHGRSFAEALLDAGAPSPRNLQYFESRGCRALYHKGWKAVAYHPRVGASWDGSDPERSFSEDRWELYCVESDFSETIDLAAEEPERLARLIELWWVEAGRHNVLPLDNRGVTRNALPRPKLITPRMSYVFRPSYAGAPERAVLNLRGQSYTIAASVVISGQGGNGVLISQGSRFAGFTLFVQDRHLRYHYSYLGLLQFDLLDKDELPAGGVTLGYRFDRSSDGSGIGALLVNDKICATGTLARTVPNTMGTGGDYMFIGRDGGSPVTAMYQAPFPFDGELREVRVEITDPVSHDLRVLAAVEDARQ